MLSMFQVASQIYKRLLVEYDIVDLLADMPASLSNTELHDAEIQHHVSFA